MKPAHEVPSLAWRDGFERRNRVVPAETPVALTYNRLCHAVMMASPVDLEDFAVGFSLTEGIIEHAGEIHELEVVEGAQGMELRMWIEAGRRAALEERRRTLAGPTGCGLCGLDSLQQAVRPPRVVDGRLRVGADEIGQAVAGLPALQRLNSVTHAVHAAGFWRPGAGMVALREDVGRHNALDKLAGALARSGQAGEAGMVVMTSRVSVELVQKAAVIGAPVLVALSAPTLLAIEMAERAGVTLVGVARPDGFEAFSHPGALAASTDAVAGLQSVRL